MSCPDVVGGFAAVWSTPESDLDHVITDLDYVVNDLVYVIFCLDCVVTDLDYVTIDYVISAITDLSVLSLLKCYSNVQPKHDIKWQSVLESRAALKKLILQIDATVNV